MAASHKWSRTVFRLRGLPNNVTRLDDAATLIRDSLDLDSIDAARIFSLATSLSLWEMPPTKVATAMFNTPPPIVQDNPSQEEWHVCMGGLGSGSTYDLILDTHFMGMTPLNDVHLSSHLHDCIAISGLASHPFGSWQPKGTDKTFMWIRDELPKHLEGTRVIIYGYDTGLQDSQSFQSISDLGRGLINQLQTYGWGLPTAKPLAFLAHSLGGLVLKDALVQLDKGSTEAYKNLIGIVRGAIFFGVPNLGMEQSHIRTIVQDNPNEALVEDIARNSNYLCQLDKDFKQAFFHERLKCFWAFETSKSPTTHRTGDGTIGRHGPPAILVSRESATCRFNEIDPSITLPMNATHSDMVKFTRDHLHYHDVISKLLDILSSTRTFNERSSLDNLNRQSEAQLAMDQDLPQHDLSTDLSAFKQATMLTQAEQGDFAGTEFKLVDGIVRAIQANQEQRGDLMNMRRLEPFLLSMHQFSQISEVGNVFVDLAQVMGYVWGPMAYIFRTTSAFREAFNSILDAYANIGEQLSRLRLQRVQPLLVSVPHFRDILVMVYQDILWFHQETMAQLKLRNWSRLFEASKGSITSRVDRVGRNLEQSRRLIENRASFTQLEKIRDLRAGAARHFEQKKESCEARQRDKVVQWLSPFHCENEHERHRSKRSICKDPGRWLLKNDQFKCWISPDSFADPMLWLSGIPGAGKTVLASIVVDELKKLGNATVAFFYCRHGEVTRNSFIGVARSILVQLLVQIPSVLPCFFQKASVSSEVVLTSTETAKDMIQTALYSCERTYLVIDGIDECERSDQPEIAKYFRVVVDECNSTETCSINCLFLSQDDGVAQKSFGGLPHILVTDENQQDLRHYAGACQKRIEEKFAGLLPRKFPLANIIFARAQGMFIFAELYAQYLEDSPSAADLEDELQEAKMPLNLDQVYDRILQRVVHSADQRRSKVVRQILGWIVCARRPLKWREVQAAVCINVQTQAVDYRRKLLQSPKQLFASFVEVRADDTVELVHGTARDYLLARTNPKLIDHPKVDAELALLSVAYLSFPHMNKRRSEDEIRSDLLSGVHAFYDYATACWVLHLQGGISQLQSLGRRAEFQKTLENFAHQHKSETHVSLTDIKRIQKMLLPIKDSKLYGDITQAIGWAKKQTGKKSQGPTQDDALDIWEVTAQLRSVLESLQAASQEPQTLENFYGTNLFKCPRVNCLSYYTGFTTADQRQHHLDKHDRPYHCTFVGCHMEIFGFATMHELKKHLFEFHGTFDDAAEVAFPEPSKGETTETEPAGTFQCNLCSKTYTTKYNLNIHLAKHEGAKPFPCPMCTERFTSQSDATRHELVHGEKKFICDGPLKDGKNWGCKAAFRRADKLADHLQSKKGHKCLRPLVDEKLAAGGGEGSRGNEGLFAGQVGRNADALLKAGKSMPSFGEFLQLLRLEKSDIHNRTV
ncbi:hypothetical protein B0T22DRAFT_493833 [Podospora appendiculata]|uniref:C2H2-type domain-containing protein n=1 Tax=Podospora appendiculata TaxID=314037 RepID=A0AAE0X3Y1_9PEZI|nr:hypothetical protein B0T22DRAFT_493833 [Podospora appendiculata]